VKTHNHLTGCGGSWRPQPHVARAPKNGDTGDGARLDAGGPAVTTRVHRLDGSASVQAGHSLGAALVER
jgi:hypothetical protein